MKEFFKKTGITVGIVLLLVLAALLALSFFGGGIHSLRDVFAPADRLVNAGMRELEKVYAYMAHYDAIEAENAALRARIAEMEEEVRESVSTNEENARLRELLELTKEHTDFRYAEVSLISWTSSSWASSFTVNKGTDHGVEKGDCVVTQEGFLVGRVIKAGKTSALVQTILDSASGVGAVAERTGVTAVAEGSYELMNEGRLRLTYLSDPAGVVGGDLITSSGKGGVYPSGLIVGTVESVSIAPDGLSAYGIVLPSAEFASMTELFVITDFTPED
jgi:rod shape-determining protein MreC